VIRDITINFDQARDNAEHGLWTVDWSADETLDFQYFNYSFNARGQRLYAY